MSVAPDLLLCGNTPVASVLAEGTDPRALNCPVAEDQYPFFRKDPYTWPRFGGAFLRASPFAFSWLVSHTVERQRGGDRLECVGVMAMRIMRKIGLRRRQLVKTGHGHMLEPARSAAPCEDHRSGRAARR